MKKVKSKNYKTGALKRKLGIKPGLLKPGDLISKMNEQKLKEQEKQNSIKSSGKTILAIKGLI